ncbi:MAG: acyl-CoA dehydrogenase family protein [Aliidongia sp.]
MRCLAIAGALETVLAMTVDNAQQRVQFGRPIGKFQAIQQSLAILAGQTVAAGAAADIAVDALRRRAAFGPDRRRQGAGRRGGQHRGRASRIRSMVRSASPRSMRCIFFTKRLWSWRDEFGNEAEWNLALGRLAAQAGERLWPDIIAA